MSSLATSDPVLAEFASEVGAEDPVAVRGAQTWTAVAARDGVRLVSAPTGIVSYTPDEMTVTVRAGTLVSDLHAELAAHGQRSALSERGGTVGGAFAVGENCVSVLGRGRIRTALLQVRYISAEGKLITGGGPTVKNVTGFDIPRIMVGSLGTLGLLAEVIIRTNPIPAESVWLTSTDADPFAVTGVLHQPSAILWDGSTTWVELEGRSSAVASETAKLTAIGSFAQADGAPELPARRWSLAPAELRGAKSETLGAFVAAIGVGTIWAERPQPVRSIAEAVAIVTGRMKNEFDPSGRLNPGVIPGVTQRGAGA